MDDGTDRWMDGWKKLHKKQPRRPLLYVILHNFSCGGHLWDDFNHMVVLLGQFQRGFN